MASSVEATSTGGAVVVTEGAVGAVVLQQVGEHGRRGQIVDCSDLDVTGLATASLQLEDAAEGETTDTTKAVDTNLNCHVFSLCRVGRLRMDALWPLFTNSVYCNAPSVLEQRCRACFEHKTAIFR